jgi:hypothetical protein
MVIIISDQYSSNIYMKLSWLLHKLYNSTHDEQHNLILCNKCIYDTLIKYKKKL